MTRHAWTYREVRIVPAGRLWCAAHDTGLPLRAESRAAMRRQIDQFHRHMEATKAAIRAEREALGLPPSGGVPPGGFPR